MDLRLKIFLCLLMVALASALTLEHKDGFRNKRDVTDTIKQALDDAGTALSEAGDAVVHVVKPTEKSVVDKIADGIKSV